MSIEDIEKSISKAPQKEKDGDKADGHNRLLQSKVLSTGDCIVALNSLDTMLLDHRVRKRCNDRVVSARHGDVLLVSRLSFLVREKDRARKREFARARSEGA